MILHPLEAAGRTRAVLRWTSAGLCVVAAHLGLGWWVLAHPLAQAEPPDTAQGIIIDLEPAAAPQNAPDPGDTAASDAASPPPPPDTMPPPPPEPPPEPVSPPPAPPPVPAPEPAPITPPPMESKSDAVVAPPPPPKPDRRRKPKPVTPKPQPPKPQPPKPDPRKLARETAERKALAEARRRERTEARDRVRESGGQTRQAAPPSSVSSGAAVATWRGEVRAHLDAYGSASPNGASGTVRVAFSVDRNGRVLSAGVAGSSGDSALDAAAVALVRRASPVPAPPSELGGRVGIVAPVRFE